MFLKTPPEILRRPPLWIIKLTIKLCVFLVHVLSGHYICILVNYSSFCVCLRLVPNFSQFKYLSSEILCYNSAEIMDTILTRMRTLLKVRYRQRVLNTFWRARVSLVLECLRILPSGHGCIKIYSLKLLQKEAFRQWLFVS